MLKFAQSILFTIAIVCLALTTASTQRDKANREIVNAAIEKLQQLKDDKSISSREFYDLKDHFTPLLYPTLHDPWLLRHLSPIGSLCLIAMFLLSFASPSIGKKASRPARLIKGFPPEHPNE